MATVATIERRGERSSIVSCCWCNVLFVSVQVNFIVVQAYLLF